MSIRNIIEVNFNHNDMANDAVRELEMDLLESITHAAECGVAQPIIVAVLQAYLYQETALMIGDIND